MGTLDAGAAVHGLAVTIVSGDRDLPRLVGPLVQVFMPKGQDGEHGTCRYWAAELTGRRHMFS
jgi:5'-3' exonuclease